MNKNREDSSMTTTLLVTTRLSGIILIGGVESNVRIRDSSDELKLHSEGLVVVWKKKINNKTL